MIKTHYGYPARKTNLKMKGAVLLEATLILTLMIGLIGAFIHYTLCLHYYNSLSNAVTATLRSLSVDVNRTGYPNTAYTASALTSSSSPAYVGTQIRDYVKSKGSLSKSLNITFGTNDVCIYKDTNNECRLKVTASVEIPCIICLYARTLTIKITSETAFEDPCFRTATTANPTRGCADASIPSSCP